MIVNWFAIETLAQVFSCESCKIYKNIFFTEYFWMTASAVVDLSKLDDLLAKSMRIQLWRNKWKCTTAQKVSVFGVFPIHIYPHSDWIRRDTKYPSELSPNAEKYGPENLWIRTLFTQCTVCRYLICKLWSGDPSLPGVPFLYPQKTENGRFSDVFGGGGGRGGLV